MFLPFSHVYASFTNLQYSNWPVTDGNGNTQVAQAVILGLGSMFNHSSQEQNIVWERDPERLMITYKALRDIPIGEELCKSTLSIFGTIRALTRKVYHTEATLLSRTPMHQSAHALKKSLKCSTRSRSTELEARGYRYNTTT